MQPDIDFEGKAQFGVERGGERAVFGQALRRVDQPADARPPAGAAAGECGPGRADRHWLAVEQAALGKGVEHGLCHRRMEGHESVGTDRSRNMRKQRQARQRLIDQPHGKASRQPLLHNRDIGVQPVAVEHQARPKNLRRLQRLRQLGEIGAHRSMPNRPAI